jgi:uncharacterized protein YkwD
VSLPVDSRTYGTEPVGPIRALHSTRIGCGDKSQQTEFSGPLGRGSKAGRAAADVCVVRTRIAVLVVAAIGLLAVWAPVAGAASVTEASGLESRLADRINALRRSHGLHTVRIVPRLAQASDRHSRSMAVAAYFRHELFTPGRDPGWTSFGTWIRWYYPGPGYTSWRAGENLAWGAPAISARQAINRWMASPMHRENLLEPSWRNLGVSAVHVTAPAGYFGEWDEVTIVVADFGRRS